MIMRSSAPPARIGPERHPPRIAGRKTDRAAGRTGWLALTALLALVASSCGISGNDVGGGTESKTDLAINNVTIAATDSSALIAWNTTETTAGTLALGANSTNLSTNYSSNPSAEHSVPISGLRQNTVYWYQITAVNSTGKAVQTPADTFRTQIAPDLTDHTPPVISNIQVIGITMSTATVLWTTDDRTLGTVYYGTSPVYGAFLAEPDSLPLAQTHSLFLTGLVEATTYHFCISASNHSKLSSQSADQVFTTAPRPICSSFRPPSPPPTATPSRFRCRWPMSSAWRGSLSCSSTTRRRSKS